MSARGRSAASVSRSSSLTVRSWKWKRRNQLLGEAMLTAYSLPARCIRFLHAPVEAEYEFRLRYQNFRGTETVVQDDGPQRGAPRGGVAAAGQPAAAVPRPSRDEQNRLAAPPVEMTFAVDGRQVYSYVIEGNADYNYARGENIVRVKLTAGDHKIRGSFPEYANLADARRQLNPDGRRKLYIDFIEMVGPFSVASTRPAGLEKVLYSANGNVLRLFWFGCVLLQPFACVEQPAHHRSRRYIRATRPVRHRTARRNAAA